MKQLVPLRIYSYYDFLNSTISPKKYIEFLKENKFKIAPFLSKESVFGLYEFVKLTEKNNIKPMIGTTFSNVIVKNRKIEITCYPKGLKGYKNMNFLSSIAMQFKKEFISVVDLQKTYKDLIFVISLNKNINSNNFDEIKEEISFISEDLYWGQNEQTDFNLIQKILNKNKIVEFESIRVLTDSEKPLLEVLKKIKNIKEKIKKENIFSFFDVLNKKKQNILIKNKEELISKIFLKIPKVSSLRINRLQKNFTNEEAFKKLKNLCFNKLNKLNLNINYKNRLDEELRTIKDKKFSNYFLIVKEYVDFAIKKEILVGPGRGSAPGSLVCFLLNITRIDPIKYDLLFERFLNKERKGLPDIDIDFEDSRRNEIIEHVVDFYGFKKVGLISTFQKIAIKSAIRDVGRALGINLSEILEIIKEIPVFNNHNIEKIIKNSIQLKYINEKYPNLFKFAQKIIGFPRQQGIHAAGLVISNLDLDNLTGTWNDGNNSIIQIDMKLIEDLGLVKMDFLGLKNLTLISNILNKLNINKNKNDFLSNIILDDKETFELLSNGLTKGIFQLESSGMTQLIKQIKPKELEDIVTTISLFRPGSIKHKELFLKRRWSEKKYEDIIPEFTSILIKTKGIPIFQEQIIQIVQIFSGLSTEKADILRRAISKKDKILFKSFETLFFTMSRQNKRSEELIKKIWTTINEFVKYGFNRSHAVGYSMISYWMAFLKTKKLNIFFVELLNIVIGDEKKTNCYLNILFKNKTLFKLPSVNRNIYFYKYHSEFVFIPLIIIKNIGNVFLKNLKEERKKNGLFKDIFDFIIRMSFFGLTKTIYKNLVFSGALDSFVHSRESMIQNFENIIIYFKTIKIKYTNKVDLTLVRKPEFKFFEDNEENNKIKQKEVIGFNF